MPSADLSNALRSLTRQQGANIRVHENYFARVLRCCSCDVEEILQECPEVEVVSYRNGWLELVVNVTASFIQHVSTTEPRLKILNLN